MYLNLRTLIINNHLCENYPELHLKTQSVPRSKHTMSQL